MGKREFTEHCALKDACATLSVLQTEHAPSLLKTFVINTYNHKAIHYATLSQRLQTILKGYHNPTHGKQHDAMGD